MANKKSIQISFARLYIILKTVHSIVKNTLKSILCIFCCILIYYINNKLI